jgi:hypothetical protein
MKKKIQNKFWERKCPQCNKIIKHKDKYACLNGIKKESLCGGCSRKKIGKNNKGRVRTDEFKEKLSQKMTNHPSIRGNKERNDKISNSLKGRDTSYRWINHTKEIIKCINCLKTTNSQKHRLSAHHFCTRECQTTYYRKEGIWKPRFNPKSIPLIEQYGKENGYNFKHALNGGEYKIPNLPYFVDGYDLEKNTIIEYYEKHHETPSQKIKDDIRRKKIINNLECKFIVLYYNKKIKIYE